MAKKQFVPLCTRCESPLRSAVSFCPACGGPTQWATHDDRVAWEVRQWRASRARRGPESTTTMMLVRTDEGYAPVAVDRSALYVWDQPLHPEREARAVAPEASRRPSSPEPDYRGNGLQNGRDSANGNGNGHAVDAVAALAAENARDFAAYVPTTSAAATAPADDGRISVSKKAIAVGVVLVIGLPLGGKVLSLAKSLGRAPSVASAPISDPAAPPAALQARSGFSLVSRNVARFAAVIRNPNSAMTATGIKISLAFVDAAGRRVGTQVERVPAIVPGASVAVAGQLRVASRIARVKASVTVGRFQRGSMRAPFVVRGVRFFRSGGVVVVRALVSAASAVRHAPVVAVHVDKSGAILGGDLAYVDIPQSPDLATVVVSTAGVPARVTEARVYVLPQR